MYHVAAVRLDDLLRNELANNRRENSSTLHRDDACQNGNNYLRKRTFAADMKPPDDFGKNRMPVMSIFSNHLYILNRSENWTFCCQNSARNNDCPFDYSFNSLSLLFVINIYVHINIFIKY